MARDLTAGMVTQITAASLTPIFLMEMEIPSGTIRFWNGLGSLTWSGNVYTGAANIITFSEIAETQAIEARGLQFTLNGINTALVSAVLDNANELQRATVNLRMAALDSSDNVVADPYLIFSGLVDTAEIMEAGDNSKIVINAESKLIRLKRTRARRYTSEDQKSEFSADEFFDFVTFLQDAPLEWGKGQ